MIGVVVWSNAAREKAVIWCEDHAALAYLQGQENLTTSDIWPEPGDLLELDTEVVGNLRHARSVSMVAEQCRVDLPALLMQAQPEKTQLKLVSDNSNSGGEQPLNQGVVPIRVAAAR